MVTLREQVFRWTSVFSTADHIMQTFFNFLALSSRLSYVDVFRDARSEVEQQIDDALHDKVDAFLELGWWINCIEN